MKTNTNKWGIKVSHTVEPDRPISETEWFEELGVSKSASKPHLKDRASDLMNQYNEGGSINPAYIELIKRMKI
jgi:hypothetical protein